MSGIGAVEPQACDARPRLALRVGVTGKRDLQNADLAKLEEVVASVLDDITAAVRASASDSSMGKLYADGEPTLTLISALAEGADRLVARLAVERKWRLAAPLPFSRAEYEGDFPKTVNEFRALLEVAMADGQVVELAGARQREQDAYHEVGRFVLRHSDILIAIWDGGPPARSEARRRSQARRARLGYRSYGSTRYHRIPRLSLKETRTMIQKSTNMLGWRSLFATS